MAAEVSQWNFITDRLPISDDYVPMFLFFSKKDLLDPKTGEFGFRSLKPFQRILLRLMCWLTRTFKGSVYLCYMEQLFIGSQIMTIPPALRCSLSNDIVMVFLLNKKELSGDSGSANATLLNILFKDDLDNNLRYKDRVVHAVKKLICHYLMLISKEVLYTSSNNIDQESDLTGMVDWTTSNYRMGGVDKKVVGYYGGMLFRLPVGNTEKFSAMTLFSAAARYFIGGDRDLGGSQVDPEFAIWTTVSKFFSPGASPVFRAFTQCNETAPVLDFLDRLLAAERTVLTGDLLLFRYDLDDLFSIHNFNAFEEVSLYGYPHLEVPPNKVMTLDDHVKAAIASGIITNGNPPSALEKAAGRVIYPHLTPIIGLGDAVDRSIQGSDKLLILNLKIELFRNILLKNATKIPVEPISTIYTKIQKLLLRESTPARALAHQLPTGFVCSLKSPDITPRFMDTYLLKEMFVKHVGCTRCGQAVTEFSYIIYNTAPRWKQSRIMLVNYTRPGQGKTFTNSVIMELLAPVGEIFEELSNFTATSFKYTARSIGKIMFMDDVGFTSEQQKTISREDNIIQNHFKCMLDKGYTNNNVTQWDNEAHKYGTAKIISIQNIGFIWNTNTLAPFGGALRDRSVILGPEPTKKKIIAKGETQITNTLAENGLTELATTLFLRQQLIQTIIYTLTDMGGVSNKHSDFLIEVLTVLGNHYPTFQAGNRSIARDMFKILDLAYADTIRVAITAVLDLWLPPWTVPPEIKDGELVTDYLTRLDQARRTAMDEMDLAAIVIEVLAQINVFLPSSIVQTATISFNQETGSIVSRVCEFLVLAMAHKHLEMTIGEHGTIVINRPHSLDPHFENDISGIFKVAKGIMMLRGNDRVKLVHGLKARENGVSEIIFDGALMLELYKSAKPGVFADLWDQLIGAFTATDDKTIWFLPESMETINTLRLFATLGIKGVFGELDTTRFQIHRDFAGLDTEIFRRELDRDSAVDGFISVDMRDRAINLEPYAKEMGGLDPSVITRDGVHVSFLDASFHATTIKRFGVGFINIPGIATRFTHCRAATFALGDEIKLCKTKPSIPIKVSGWEYELAGQVYKDYTHATIDDPVTHLSSYLCATTPATGLVKDDAYLVRLSETLGRVTYEDLYRRSPVEYATTTAPGAPTADVTTKKRRISDDGLDLAIKIRRLVS
ncbi:ORF56 [black bullhead herpesvirus]|uniref:ORF56 n=1 Tax=black bullhead herpesvirus TaxID=508441 RepID=A0A2H5AJI7_9VIRU|nr:ORF56 [black bullhead herpesvirus]AUG72311.1 ORF56 [black bullhead herpesvirus]